MTTVGILSSVLFAGCGGGASPPGVASIGAAKTTTTSPFSSATAPPSPQQYQQALAYSKCMRSHGVRNFPDPNASGGIQINGSASNGGNASNGLNPGSPQFTSANNACQHLLPNGGQPTPQQQQAAQQNALKMAQCMRTHGVPNFPDPQFVSGGVRISIKAGSGVDPGSPEFQKAQEECGMPRGKGIHSGGPAPIAVRAP